MQEKQINIKGLSANYKTFGQGQMPLLILHGWPSNSDRWQKVAELLEGKFFIIAPDLPGFGKSEAPKTAWSVDNYVDWLEDFTNALPELQGEFYLLGHSFGGALASKYTIKFNQRVKKLFLVSAACVRKKTGLKKFYYGLTKIFKIFSFIPGYALFRKAFYKYVIRRSDYIYQNGVMKETYLKVILDDLSYKVRFINVPTVIIWGDKDESTPLEQGKLIHEKVVGSTLAIIEGADHSLHIKMPAALSQKILETV